MTIQRFSIIVVICHDLGRHMGCYGLPNVRTPNFDAFAESGLRFENSFCTAPQCSPSRAALWTGRYPHANGVVGLAHWDFQNDLNESERHLGQILAEAGYSTHLFGSQHVSPRPERCGFKHVHGDGRCGKIASDFTDFLSAWDAKDGPLFAEVAFVEPHRPFRHDDIQTLDPKMVTVLPYLPDIPEVREDIADLEASVASADMAFGRIVEAIDSSGFGENAIVVFTTDHGIAFPHAKMTLYDPGIETALLMRVPGIEGGKVYQEMISNVDFVPTILDLLGMEIPPNLQGRSFKALMAGTEYRPNTAVFAEKTYHAYYDPMRAIRTKRWKLIANFEFAPWQETAPDFDNDTKSYPEICMALNIPGHKRFHPPFELYDLESDPCEQNNLADSAEFMETRDRLIRRLREWMKDTGDPLLDGPMAQAAYKKRMATFKVI